MIWTSNEVINGVVLDYSFVARKKVHLLCSHHTVYIIHSTLGRSIASISDLGVHIYLGSLHLRRICVGYGPPYQTIIYYI